MNLHDNYNKLVNDLDGCGSTNYRDLTVVDIELLDTEVTDDLPAVLLTDRKGYFAIRYAIVGKQNGAVLAVELGEQFGEECLLTFDEVSTDAMAEFYALVTNH